MEILKKIRAERGYNQQKLAKLLNISRSTVAMWETNKAEPNSEMLVKLSEIFGVSVDYLLNNKNNISAIKVPVLGYVAAGVPIEAIQDILDYEELDPQQFNPNYEYFGLKIKGDSMTPRIQDGDVVIVRRQPAVENGNIAIVCVNGDEATCKQIKVSEDGISLISFNPAYPPKFYTNKEVAEIPITFMGKVVELRGKL